MNKVYAIFGASGGIGEALIKQLSAKESTLYLLGRDEAKLKALSIEFSHPYLTLDASDEEQVKNALNMILKNEGRLDGVVSLVGSFFLKPIHLTTLKEFEEVMKTNVSSSFLILKHALPLMEKGSVVLSSSTAALIGLASHEVISAAKSAVLGLVKSAAASYAHKGIRINAVAPGLTRTPLTASITQNPQALKASTAFHPLGRIGESEDVASAIYWLLSDESSFMTSEVIAIDGGLSNIKLKSSSQN